MTTNLIMAALVVATLGYLRWRHGGEGVRTGVGEGITMVRRIAPMLVLGMLIASMAEVALPPELIDRWLGDESGFTGILIGIGVGALVPAGPYVTIPLLGSLMAAGAGIGPLAAFLTAWSVIPISRSLVWETPFLGPAFSISRYVVALPFPLAAGVLAPPVFRLFE